MSPYIKQIRFVFKGLKWLKTETRIQQLRTNCGSIKEGKAIAEDSRRLRLPDFQTIGA
jgi:hypothetical protein